MRQHPHCSSVANILLSAIMSTLLLSCDNASDIMSGAGDETPPPSACFTIQTLPAIKDSTVFLDASCTQVADSDLSAVRFDWDWENDGIYDSSALGNPLFRHTWNIEGVHYVVLRVTDAHDQIDLDTVAIRIASLPDSVRPVAITDLSVGIVDRHSVQLLWTAPGDDRDIGTAAQYDVRYSESRDTLTQWTHATGATGEPTPGIAGSNERFTVTGLDEGTAYSFAIKTRDEAIDGWSSISNLVEQTTDTTVYDLVFTELTFIPPLGAIDTGQVLTIRAKVRNDGSTGDGRISIAFPGFNSMHSIEHIVGHYFGTRPPDLQAVYTATLRLPDAYCGFTTASYLLAEGRDQGWMTGEENTYEVVVIPRQLTGEEFLVDVRSTIEQPGNRCDFQVALPPGDADGVTDQQGYDVKRFTFTVTAPVDTPQVPVLKFVPAGTFIMGDGVAHCGIDEREVVLTNSFYLGQTEVTNEEYRDMLQWAYDREYIFIANRSGGGKAVCDNLDGSTARLAGLIGGVRFDSGVFAVLEGKEKYPINYVSWHGAAAYCDWLSMLEGLPRAYDHATWECNGGDPYGAEGYRLPTEAEWEYAAQYDDERIFPWGEESPSGHANIKNGMGEIPVASYAAAPAELGLYDMVGNLWEWCNDWVGPCNLGTAPEQNPTGPLTGSYHAQRGASYYEEHDVATRSAARGGPALPPTELWLTGIRVARSE